MKKTVITGVLATTILSTVASAGMFGTHAGKVEYFLNVNPVDFVSIEDEMGFGIGLGVGVAKYCDSGLMMSAELDYFHTMINETEINSGIITGKFGYHKGGSALYGILNYDYQDTAGGTGGGLGYGAGFEVFKKDPLSIDIEFIHNKITGNDNTGDYDQNKLSLGIKYTF